MWPSPQEMAYLATFTEECLTENFISYAVFVICSICIKYLRPANASFVSP